MIKLSERLAAMAALIDQGETVADVGTDHGLLPLALWEREISPKVIFSDVQIGPLERAKENIGQYFPGNVFDLRLGSGLETLQAGEVDAVTIAGMGGLLIIQILEHDLQKAKSFKKYIFQPRNAQDKLRKWLVEHGFCINNEVLVREGKYICEILSVSPSGKGAKDERSSEIEEEMGWEISPHLFWKKDPLLSDFIGNKLKTEQKILGAMLAGATENTTLLQSVTKRMEKLEELWERSKKDEHQDEHIDLGN